MNPYTLSFKDQQLQQRYYNESYFSHIQYRIFIIISIASLCLGIINTVTTLDEFDHIYSKIGLSITLYCLFSSAFICKFPQYTNYGLFCYNLLLAFNLFELPSSYDGYLGLLMGSAQMIVHTSILFIMRFHFSVINNLLICGIFLSSGTYFSTISLFQYTFIISIFISFTFSLFFLEKTKREWYLSSVKDNTIDKIFTNFIKKPFYIFTYNTKTSQLELFMKNSEQQLDDLLNNAIYKKQKLKNYIFSKIFSNENQHQSNNEYIYLTVTLFNMRHVIKYEHYSRYYMLSIESMEEFVIDITEIYTKKICNVQDYFVNVLNRLSKLVTYQSIEKSIKLKFSIHQIINYIKLHSIGQTTNNIYPQIRQTQKLEFVNLSQELRQLISYTNRKGKLDIELIEQENIKIRCPRMLIQIYLLELMKQIKFKQQTKIQLSKSQAIILEINNLESIPMTQLYAQLSRYLVDQHIIQGRHIMIIFKKEVDLPFQQINLLSL